ncbi:MAG: amino acid permease [Phycisphaerales bacterium]|nr:amino acid permease [Phycisphaerales bacterium]
MNKKLSTFHLVTIAIGCVISGFYFGWNIGVLKGGTYGMLLAVVLVSILFLLFCFCYTELVSAIPKVGGGVDFTNRAFGKVISYCTGYAQFVELNLALPAIAIAIGTYLNMLFHFIPIVHFSIAVYIFFALINISGIRFSSTFEVIVACVSLLGLFFYCFVSMRHFSWDSFLKTDASLPKLSLQGLTGALPFAIWIFLGIDSLANLSEDVANPQKSISKAFLISITLLIGLFFLVYFFSIGIAGPLNVIYLNHNVISDAPLLDSLYPQIYNELSWHCVVISLMGLIGLLASFNGLMLSNSRLLFGLSRIGFAPSFLKRTNTLFKTPVNAILLNTLIGIVIIISGTTETIIILSVLGALVLYFFSVLALIRLRITEPNLKRPFKVPFYPYLPIIVLILIGGSIVKIVLLNAYLSILYFFTLVLFFLVFITLRYFFRHSAK